MNRLILSGVGASAIVAATAGAAMALSSGGLNVSTDGAYTYNGTYNFYSSSCRFATNAWDGYVAGRWKVVTPNDHLNGTVDGYGWTRLKNGTAVGDVGYAYCIAARDVLVHDSISLQACREHWYGDDCKTSSAHR